MEPRTTHIPTRRGDHPGLTDNTSQFATPLTAPAADSSALFRASVSGGQVKRHRLHDHESWQLAESASGGQYCRACGGSIVAEKEPGEQAITAQRQSDVDGAHVRMYSLSPQDKRFYIYPDAVWSVWLIDEETDEPVSEHANTADAELAAVALLRANETERKQARRDAVLALIATQTQLAADVITDFRTDADGIPVTVYAIDPTLKKIYLYPDDAKTGTVWIYDGDNDEPISKHATVEDASAAAKDLIRADAEQRAAQR